MNANAERGRPEQRRQLDEPDGQIVASEDCKGADLGGLTCEDVGYYGGTLEAIRMGARHPRAIRIPSAALLSTALPTVIV